VVLRVLRPVGAADDVELQEQVGRYFANDVSYRVKPILDYILQTKPWKQQLQQQQMVHVLDWGAGGGLLATYLAAATTGGATPCVVAVKIDPVAVQAAKCRLKPFPHATAVQSRNANEFPPLCLHSQQQSFDIIVWHQGAIRDTHPERYQQVCFAAKAIRDGGSVIVAQFPKVQSSRAFLNIRSLLGGVVLGKLLASRPGRWFSVLGTIAPWFLVFHALRIGLAWLEEDHKLYAEMLAAGFSDIRKSSKLFFWPCQ
jgi:SAM-dependent methyltransferase